MMVVSSFENIDVGIVQNDQKREISRIFERPRGKRIFWHCQIFDEVFEPRNFYFAIFFGQCFGKIKQVLLAYAGKSY
jgi:hypothetical protein